AGQFLPPIAALTAFARKAVANFEFSRCKIAHQAQPADSTTGVAAQIHDESAASVECCDTTVDVLRYIDADSAWEHRDSQQSNFIAQPFGGRCLREIGRASCREGV